MTTVHHHQPGQSPSGGRDTPARPGRPLVQRLRGEEGSAVVEFPMVAALIVLIALGVVQAALIVHTRNTLIDAAVQGAHHASLVGASPEDGAERAERLISDRFGDSFQADATAAEGADGTIEVEVSATLPLVGLFGPAGTLTVEGRAIDEETW
ncbi:TadE family protein [Brachybacterium fresconis]|uniref:Flp pilus assembly protein TadG n=1 Tax=Brachybacterium fresconis TaxID=173363 RepID=A0ABS4YH79_9MICO|nr:TadE/TadG family type IV pilus assembly protein [Brachybacterium fresconis]MBP2408152.1 Flp pilus assembly protein TadG [Brachybacterium fresconis]